MLYKTEIHHNVQASTTDTYNIIYCMSQQMLTACMLDMLLCCSSSVWLSSILSCRYTTLVYAVQMLAAAAAETYSSADGGVALLLALRCTVVPS